MSRYTPGDAAHRRHGDVRNGPKSVAEMGDAARTDIFGRVSQGKSARFVQQCGLECWGLSRSQTELKT